MKRVIIDSPQWTVRSLADELGISERMIYAHIENGNIAADVLHGRVWVISDDAATKFITDYKAGAFPVGKHK